MGNAAVAAIMELTPATSITALRSLERFSVDVSAGWTSNQTAIGPWKRHPPAGRASAVGSGGGWARTDLFSRAPRQLKMRDHAAVTGPVPLGAGVGKNVLDQKRSCMSVLQPA